MRILIIFLLAVINFLSVNMIVKAQPSLNWKPKLLRFEEDYSPLNDSMVKKNPLLGTKNISIHRSKNITASFGLDFREMYQYVKGYDSGAISDGFWLTRFMVHADFKIGNHLRIFLQPASGIVAGRKLPPRSVDKDQLFLLNAFAEYQFGKQKRNYLRVGREEFFYGMGRLIAPREGPNIRNSYDGVRLHIGQKQNSIDGFFSYVVNNKQGVFDNEILGNNQRLWGLYLTRKGKLNTDIYYIGFYNPAALYSKQIQRDKETRHSIGIRGYGKFSKTFGYDAELVYQFGKFGNYNIDAFLGDVKLSGQWTKNKSQFTLSTKFTYASGNSSLTNNRMNTYNPLFPNLLYYQTAIGLFPANLINPQTSFEWKHRKLTLAAGADFFWRASEQDGLYAPFGFLPLSNGYGKYLGYQFFNLADYQLTQNLGMTFLLSRYYKSSFVKANTDGRGVDLLINLILNIKL